VDLACAIASRVILLIAFVIRPTSARCPEHWHHSGIRPSGDFECTREPVGSKDMDGTWQHPERSVVPPGALQGRIYCTGGTEPIVVTDRATRSAARTVGCQRE
jgi:hypothetical protein